MSFALDSFSSRHDSVAVPTLWLAFAASLLLHALFLLGWIPLPKTTLFEDLKLGKPQGAIAVRIAPPPRPAPPPAPPSPPAKAAQSSRPLPTNAPQPKPAPKILAAERSPVAAPARVESSRPSAKGDLAAYVEARRSAREPAPAAAPAPPPGETEQERDNRIAAERLGLTRAPTFGAEKQKGGGIFQLQRVSYDEAEFFFFGWNKAIQRRSRQMISVSRGGNPTIEIAVVRRMIAIIREYAKEDFTWESQRLGRDVQLSARLSDNAGLEDFMMQEFFSQARK